MFYFTGIRDTGVSEAPIISHAGKQAMTIISKKEENIFGFQQTFIQGIGR